jgi:hypothetical protein
MRSLLKHMSEPCDAQYEARLRCRKQLCASPANGLCRGSCKRLHLVPLDRNDTVGNPGCLWHEVLQGEFNEYRERNPTVRLCPYHFAQVQSAEYAKEMQSKDCRGCENIHISPSQEIPGMYVTVVKEKPQAWFTLTR